MKLFLNTILNLLLVSSYAQTFEWANTIGTNLPAESVASICNDDQGNVYVTGTVTATYYSFSTNNHYAHFGTDSLPIHGANDIYIAKYDAQGTLIWAKTFGGDYDWNVSTIGQQVKYEVAGKVIQMNNNIYLTAQVIGSCSIGNYNVAALNGQSKLVLLKLNANGIIQWVKSFGTDGGLNGGGMLSGFGNKLLLSGWSEFPLQIDSNHIVNGSFLTMLDADGNCIWARDYFGKKGDSKALTTLQKRIITIAAFGKYNNVDMAGNFVCNDSSRTGAVISEIDSSGNIIWYKTLTSNGYYVAGDKIICKDTASCFCNLKYTSNLFTSSDTIVYSNNLNSCIVEFTMNGEFKNFIPVNSQNVNQISIVNKRIVTTGYLIGIDTIFGSIFNSNSTQDMIICELDSFFQVSNWFQYGIGSAKDLVQFSDSTIFLLGNVGRNTQGSNNLVLENINLVSLGFEDGFIAKFNGFTSGIDDRSRKSKNINESLLIYANPSNGKCDIDIPDEFLHEKELKLSIYSSTGVLIQQAKVNMNDDVIKVDIQQEAKGMYNATLSNGKKMYTGRIVFE